MFFSENLLYFSVFGEKYVYFVYLYLWEGLKRATQMRQSRLEESSDEKEDRLKKSSIEYNISVSKLINRVLLDKLKCGFIIIVFFNYQ